MPKSKLSEDKLKVSSNKKATSSTDNDSAKDESVDMPIKSTLKKATTAKKKPNTTSSRTTKRASKNTVTKNSKDSKSNKEINTDDLVGDSAEENSKGIEYFEEGNDVNVSTDPVRDFLRHIGQVPLLNADDEKRYAIQYEIGTYAQYKLEINDYSTDEEKADLEQIALEGKHALDILVSANLRLVVSLARKFRGRGMSLQDLIHQGTFGLYRAVAKYDYAPGFRFSTYATWWVRQAITAAIAGSARIIKLPVHIVETINKINKTRKRMTVELEREPTNEELAKELDLKVSKLEEFMDYDIKPTSMNLTIGDDGDTEIADQIADDSENSERDALVKRKQNEKINKLLFSLPDKEREALVMKYGIFTGKELTLDQIGENLQLTKEGARQLVLRAIARLRHPSRRHLLDDIT